MLWKTKKDPRPLIPAVIQCKQVWTISVYKQGKWWCWIPWYFAPVLIWYEGILAICKFHAFVQFNKKRRSVLADFGRWQHTQSTTDFFHLIDLRDKMCSLILSSATAGPNLQTHQHLTHHHLPKSHKPPSSWSWGYFPETFMRSILDWNPHYAIK